MRTSIDDDELNRLVSEERKLADRLMQLRDSRAEHESALTKLDERHWALVRHIQDITEHLERASGELREVADERAGRNGERLNLAMDIKEAAMRLRGLRLSIQNFVGRDVCPSCGSTKVAQISYGYPVQDFEDDAPSVIGGCCINPDETVRCLDCGTNFLGNLDKWKRQIEGNHRETVLEVGGEGGTLAIVRQRDELGNWEYWCLRDETTMLDLLPDDEIGNRDDLREDYAHVGTFEDALFRLDQYPWYRLVPIKMCADFGDLVLREVEKRGGKEAAYEWTSRLRFPHSDE
jgi:hypothetical protein